ncbi:MAG: hypothetical protein NZ602_11120 [Thermoguttaceae bacterium]|nr:hypothetical protein [Thermoguttaceae bacterium]MDW8036728.1 hypothetical protein [Thermoguttaceae bacterium]
MTNKKTSEGQAGADERLKTTAYDRVSSWILTLLVVVGLAVGLLWLAWWTARRETPQTAVPVVPEQINTEEDFDLPTALAGPPSPAELQKEIPWPQQEISPSLNLLAEVVRQQPERWEEPTWNRPGGQGGSGQTLGGRALGWEIRFDPGNTLETYAKQLDFFGIELGVLLPNNQILYVADLSKAQPTVRQGPADQELRYYFTWRQGELLSADRELLSKAGVDPKDRLILKFLPDKWAAYLAELEKKHAADKKQKIHKTRFGVRPAGEEGYEFYVLEQTYR